MRRSPDAAFMLRYVLCTIGIVGALYMIKCREALGDLMGEPPWMRKIGGVYYVVVYIAFFIFFWSIAELTNTTQILFRPLESVMPGLVQRGTPLDF